MDEHRHQWSVVDFYVDEGRPMMRQACACGAERTLRAWDRFWDPNEKEAGHERTHALPRVTEG